MKKNHRRIISLTFILIFIIGSPLLILYTAGYRYNLKKGTIQKTGALVLETTPNRANIFLNNKDINEKTPARLNHILPEEYKVKIEKEEYYPWQKNLTIRSQETTFAEDIVLFKKSQPELIIDNQINWIKFSPNRNWAVYSITEFEQDYLYLINLKNEKTKLIFNNNGKLKNSKILWAQDDSKFILNSDKNLFIYTTVFPQKITKLEQTMINKYNLKWNNYDHNLLFMQDDYNLYSWNFYNNEIIRLFTKTDSPIIDYLFDNEKLYVINQYGETTYLNKYKHNDEKPAQFEKSLQLNNANYRFNNIYNYKIALTENNNFYLMDLDLTKIIFKKDNVQNIDYHQEANLILLQTDQEVSFIALSEWELLDKVLTRYSNNLQRAQWHNSSNYCGILQNQQIHLLELDTRNYHNIISLPFTEIDQYSFDNDSKNIYFIKNNNLYKIEIR